MRLVEPEKTVEIIKKNNISFQKRFGQNFLIDGRVLDKIITAAEIEEGDFVLEIGPGIGTMTQALAEKATRVVAVEIDKNLIPVLSENLSGCENVEIINADVMKLDLTKLVLEKNGGRPVKVVANLPYYITTPIIMSLFEKKVPMKSATLMVQKEVAERMMAQPGTKTYGALSLAVQYCSEPHIAARVPRNCFMPRPDVDSAVIVLTSHSVPPVSVTDEDLFFNVVRAAFEKRRKTLQNALSSSARLKLSKQEAADAIKKAGLPELIRGEALNISQFATLSEIIGEISREKK
ncbi:MAG: 16S rRNA (adenine(1518)-N(6)/adenine(1519)-N(6))-dimethyltransferase RsmA [Lachnospiraceae bacterium]|nr:16S rRNA (adenine(1518)-N(6)/adenine(1519)-N(6))-dimethyltransferase RsmA [Lachnospiraceae bacterium]